MATRQLAVPGLHLSAIAGPHPRSLAPRAFALGAGRRRCSRGLELPNARAPESRGDFIDLPCPQALQEIERAYAIEPRIVRLDRQEEAILARRLGKARHV